jgi:hypothetical protein
MIIHNLKLKLKQWDKMIINIKIWDKMIISIKIWVKIWVFQKNIK